MNKNKLLIITLLCVSIGICIIVQNKINQENITKNLRQQDVVDPLEANQGTKYSNQKYAWGFRKIKNSAPDVPSNIKELIRRFDGYYLGDTSQKSLYLTFDEGYENGYTAEILDILKKTNIKAAFFVTGPYLKAEGELVKRMANEGHIVGNHTINHPSMPFVTDETLKYEITELNNRFFELTGQQMKYIRPPMGEYSERTLALSKNLGYKTVFWSSAYVDWEVETQKGTQYAFEQITNQFHSGNIILLHAVSKDNCNILEELIKYANNNGYTFLSLDQL